MRSPGPGAPPPAPIPVPACPPPPGVPKSRQIPFRNTSPACLRALPAWAQTGPHPGTPHEAPGALHRPLGPGGARARLPLDTPLTLRVPPLCPGRPRPPGPVPAASRPHAACGLHPLSTVSPGVPPRPVGRGVLHAGPLLPLRSHLPRGSPPSRPASPLSWRCSARPPSPGASRPEPWPPSDGPRWRPQTGPAGPSGLRSWR